MVYHLLSSPRLLILVPLTMLLLFAMSCGGSAAEPTVIEREVVKEVPKEVIVEKEVIKEVVVEKQVLVQPTLIVEGAQTGQMEIPTAIPTPGAMEVAEVPDWVSIGATKHWKGDFPLVAARNPGFWDVHYGGSLNTTLAPSSPRFNQLLEYDPTAPTEIIGDLAKTWDVNEDGSEYTFHLHEALFSDGTPVTADDVVFSINRITMPDALRARTGFLKRFVEYQTVEAIDERTVRIPLKFASAAFIPNLASDYMKIYPRALESVSQDDFNCCPEKSFGSGPWKFRDWKKDASYSYERNDLYFKSPRPYFDALQVFLIRDATRRVAALQAGQAYANYILWACSPTDCAQLEKDTNGRVRHLVRDATLIRSLFLKITEPPFDDPRVRRAIYLGVDRPRMVELAYNGVGVPGTFFVPPYVEDPFDTSMPGYRANKEEDLAEARVLLAEAGYPNGFSTTLNAQNAGTGLALAEAVAAQLRDDLGVDFTLSTKDLATFYVDMRDGTHSASLVGTGIILRDPGDILNQMFDLDVLRNPHSWSDPRTTKLMDLQDGELDPNKRKELMEQFVEVLREGTSHIVPLAWSSGAVAMDYRMRNFYLPTTIQLIHKWDHMWFDENREMPKEPGIIP